MLVKTKAGQLYIYSIILILGEIVVCSQVWSTVFMKQMFNEVGLFFQPIQILYKKLLNMFVLWTTGSDQNGCKVYSGVYWTH